MDVIKIDDVHSKSFRNSWYLESGVGKCDPYFYVANVLLLQNYFYPVPVSKSEKYISTE